MTPTPELGKAMVALRKAFASEISTGVISSLGTYNCRRKNNTSDGPWSEHAWPNAVDVMLKRIPGTATPTAEAKAAGYRIARWMKDHPELWSEVFWQVAAHFDHVHGTAHPRRNYDNEQIPPCAGGGEDMLTPEEQEFVKALYVKEQKTGTFSKDIITRDELTTALANSGGVTLAKVKELIQKARLTIT